ncbi:class I tRNA ligase family protein, partial [Candidatus Saccharibacteria bacterium]|nr:class I tRNA ligase family protein [Candidatus Saccharibacteria bacterium]
MKFSSSYEPSQFEPDIYAAWEASGVFKPTTPTVPIDDNGDGIDDRFENIESSAIGASGVSDDILETEDAADTRCPAEHKDLARAARSASEGHAAPIMPSSTYSIVMPPPNANGNLHIGHGLTIALEDSLTRFYRLNGKSAWYIPGADHAGFETWVVYEKALEKEGHTRFEFDRNELYARVWDFVAMQRGNMELQLRALGASCSWDDLTFTLDENVIDRVYTTFEKMWNDGLIYRGKKLVNFCPKHQTAFADIEVEHQDESGTLWDLEYRLVDDVQTGDLTSIIVSTTRPETLFGDTAVAVNPDDARYKNLIGKYVHLPLTDKTIPIIADEHADPEFGTG